MNETFVHLLDQLTYLDPSRFSCNESVEFGHRDWFFEDREHDTYCHVARLYEWMFDMLNELEIAAIWKQGSRTWEESVLNAIVHRIKELKEPSEPIDWLGHLDEKYQ